MHKAFLAVVYCQVYERQLTESHGFFLLNIQIRGKVRFITEMSEKDLKSTNNATADSGSAPTPRQDNTAVNEFEGVSIGNHHSEPSDNHMVVAGDSCDNASATEKLNTFIDSLPLPAKSNVLNSNDSTNDSYDVAMKNSCDISHKTRQVDVSSMGPYKVYCGKHYAGRRRIAINRLQTSDIGAGSHHQIGLTLVPSPIVRTDTKTNLANTVSDATTNIEDSSICKDSLPQPTDVSHSHVEAENNEQSLGYVSRTLKQLEDATKNWFTSEHNRSISAAFVSSTRQQDTFDLFSLKYNESTVSTIASWVAGGPTRKRVNATSYRPIVDTRFRNCNVCGRFGHYEVECKSLSPDLIIKLSRVISGKQPLTNDNNHVPEQQHNFDVTIEMCDGYLIEQRSNSLVEPDSIEEPKEHATIQRIQLKEEKRGCNEIKIDGFVIKEGATIDALTLTSDQTEAPSNFPSPEPETVPIQLGSVVAWFWKEQESSDNGNNGIVIAGTVTNVTPDSNRVQVKVVRIINTENSVVENDNILRWSLFNEQLPGLDSLMWVSAKRLFVVDERIHSLQRKKALIRSPRKSNKVKKPAVIRKSRKLKVEKVGIKPYRAALPKRLSGDVLKKNTGRRPPKPRKFSRCDVVIFFSTCRTFLILHYFPFLCRRRSGVGWTTWIVGTTCNMRAAIWFNFRGLK
jgi:hypothetical protein